ncbi:MAG: response regulator [Pseudomonadota bacterium]
MQTTGAMLFVPKGQNRGEGRNEMHRYVLICDKNREVCKTIARIVNTLGVQAVAATDGSAAIRISARRTPDLVLYEENMPGMRASDFVNAGLSHLLHRRALLVERKRAQRARWLPTMSKPLEVRRFSQQLTALLENTGSS